MADDRVAGIDPQVAILDERPPIDHGVRGPSYGAPHHSLDRVEGSSRGGEAHQGVAGEVCTLAQLDRADVISTQAGRASSGSQGERVAGREGSGAPPEVGEQERL